MGAASSIQDSVGIEEFKKIRDEYENKLKEDGITDEIIYNHMQDIIRSVTAAQELNLSMDLIDNGDSHNNCTEEVRRKSGLNLLSNPTHRLVAVKVIIERAIKEVVTVSNEKIAPIPVVSTSQNFDSLLIPKDHYCRRASDVYYVSENALLRTHLTAHMVESVSTEAAALAVGGGEMAYFMIGPVFRRIEEDERQSELSHQLQLVHIYEKAQETESEGPGGRYVQTAESVVKKCLSEPKLRWEELEEFPYAAGDGVMSLETLFEGEPLEIAHGAQLSAEMLSVMGVASKSGYFISFDLDHLAMVSNNVTTGIKSIQE